MKRCFFFLIAACLFIPQIAKFGQIDPPIPDQTDPPKLE